MAPLVQELPRQHNAFINNTSQLLIYLVPVMTQGGLLSYNPGIFFQQGDHWHKPICYCHSGWNMQCRQWVDNYQLPFFPPASLGGHTCDTSSVMEVSQCCIMSICIAHLNNCSWKKKTKKPQENSLHDSVRVGLLPGLWSMGSISTQWKDESEMYQILTKQWHWMMNRGWMS